MLVQRAGTSSLFRMLGQHPDVASIVPETIPDDRGGLITQDPARLGNYCRSVSCAVFYSIPFFVFALLLLSPSRNSDPGSHSRLFSPPHCSSCVQFLSRGKISALSCLVDLRRTLCSRTPGVLSNCWSLFFQNLTSVGFELTDQLY